MISKTETFVSHLRIKNPIVSNFFFKVLDGFHQELLLLCNHWYNYELSIDKTAGYNDVFGLIERTYVGIFNNSVVKNFPDDAVLQEFSVHLGGKKYVRADYLVKHIEPNGYVNILFEAKQRQFDGKDYNKEQTSSYLDPFMEQAKKYVSSEKTYYKGETYLSTLVFEWVRLEKHVNQVKNWSNEDDGITDFYCFYHSDNAGLMVYGTIKAEDILLKD
jgi:hypothetical protein